MNFVTGKMCLFGDLLRVAAEFNKNVTGVYLSVI